jgi:hypothetical protein
MQNLKTTQSNTKKACPQIFGLLDEVIDFDILRTVEILRIQRGGMPWP